MKNYKKTDHFEPIAMKCTREQFDEIVNILKTYNMNILEITSFDNCEYLTNNLEGFNYRISNIIGCSKDKRNRKVYEEFDSETFLKACGIVETEPTTKVRNSVLLKLADNNSYSEEILKKECPKLFENKLEVGKWYKYINTNTLVFLEDLKKNKGYGFYDGKFESTHEKWTFYLKDKWELATPQEVETALIQEAKKRGFVKGAMFYEFHTKSICVVGYIKYEHSSLDLRTNGRCLWHNGKFATIIETPTDIITIVEKYGKDKVIKLIEKM